MKNKTIFCLAVSLILLLFFSCNKTNNHAEKEQIVTASLGAEPTILDAAKASDRYSFIVLDYINENLTNIHTDETGKHSILPGIAERWECNSDFTEWTFYLRDAFWEDGIKITANDFVYSIRRIINKESASPMAMYYDYIKNAQAILKGKMDYTEIGIKAIDEKTLKIITENPIKNLDEFAAKIPPAREDFINKLESGYGSGAGKIICSGAFKVKEWVHNSKIELIKNEKFWNAENVKIQNLTFKIINEENAVLGELINGSIDIANAYSISWINKLKKEKDIAYMTGIDSRVMYIFMNQKNTLFSNAKIRKAISASLDREEICLNLFDDVYKPAYGFVSISTELEGKNYRNLAGEPIKKLIAESGNVKQLFIEGLKELGLDEDPSKTNITVMLPTNESSKFDEYLQQNLIKKLGIQVTIDKVEPTVFRKRNKSLDYEIGFKSWAGGIDTPSRYLDLFLPGNKIVPIGWENKTYTQLIIEAKQTSSFDEKLEKFKKAEEILITEDCCIAPYANQTYNIFMSKNLKGVTQFYPGTYNLKYAYISK